MLELHRTREGNTKLIAQMDDSHLKHTIKLHLGNMAKAKAMADNTALDEYQRVLYGLPKVDMAEAAEVNRQIIQKLYPYLAEALLRGMEDVRDMLIDAMGRDAAIASGLPELPSRTITIVYDDELGF